MALFRSHRFLEICSIAALLCGCASSPKGGYVFSRDCKTEAGLHFYKHEPEPVKGYVYMGSYPGVDVNGNISPSGKPIVVPKGEEAFFYPMQSVDLAGLVIGLDYIDVPSPDGRPGFMFAPHGKYGRPGIYRFSIQHVGDPRCEDWKAGEVLRMRSLPYGMPQSAFPGEGRCVAVQWIGDLTEIAKERVFYFPAEPSSRPGDEKIGIRRYRDRLWDRQMGTLSETVTIVVLGFYGDVDGTSCRGANRAGFDSEAMLLQLR